MSDPSLLIPIAATGFGVAFAHAAIPTHWLPFVLAGRSQGWSPGKTLSVTLSAGAAHVVFTTLMGALLVGLGLAVDRWIGGVFPFVAGGILMLLGAYHLIGHLRGHGHHHAGCAHGACTHGPARAHAPARPRAASDRTTIAGLLAMLTLSPCEGFLPVYLSATHYGWTGFAVLSLILAGATVASMGLLTWLTLTGMARVATRTLERYEHAVVGTLLCLLGIAVIVLEHEAH